MKWNQIGQCCSWTTENGRFQIDYWSNANRPPRTNGTDGGYGMYSVLDHGRSIGVFTSKTAAKKAIAKAEGRTL